MCTTVNTNTFLEVVCWKLRCRASSGSSGTRTSQDVSNVMGSDQYCCRRGGGLFLSSWSRVQVRKYHPFSVSHRSEATFGVTNNLGQFICHTLASDHKTSQKVMKKRRGQKRLHIRPQCLFSSVVSTYRYNTVSFCKTKKMKLPLQSSMRAECQSRRLHLFCMYPCSP